MRGAGPSYAIVHTFVFRTQPLPPSQVYFELVLGRLSSPAVDANSVSSAVKLFQSFQEFGQEMHGDLGVAFHLAPEQQGIKTELLGQWNGDEGGFPAAIAPLLALAKDKGLNCRLDSRELSTYRLVPRAGLSS